MDETILLPSPNWFLVSNLSVSTDGWIIYGGPSKSLCVLEPLQADTGIISGNEKYQAHVVMRAHLDKIVSVDVSPNWLEQKAFLTGSADGVVKQWIVDTVKNKIKLKATHSHVVHQAEREDIIGVGYSNESTVVTVGSFSNVVKWDLTSNVAKAHNNLMKNFKPTCMACSVHVLLRVAVGTKQGVVFVLDLTGNGHVIYKVRCHDDEVMNVSWCPQYEILIKKTLKESEIRSRLSSRLDAIRNEPEPDTNPLEKSGIGKNLPEDSFDESVVQEDDMFDIYTDHEANEFGHKKYEPEDILVKIKQEKVNDSDYLAECLKLKEDILKRKNQEEPSIESLVEALDNTHVEGASQTAEPETESAQASTSSAKSHKTDAKATSESSVHIHKHLLASIGRYGGVRIWSKTGKLVSSCGVPTNAKNISKKNNSNWPTLLWYKPNSLLIVDGKSQLLECNPMKMDNKNKLDWHLVHTLHKRGLFCIASNAPRIQTESSGLSNDWSVWSISQDRNLIRYCMDTRKVLSVHQTCGGFLYTVAPCPYDAGKIAVSVGDGAVRVWETSTAADDDSKLLPGRVTTYWQNVQGKVLTVAWHPTKENLIAFGTAEARVGLIDTSGKNEKPARVLQPAISHGVYSLCWGEGMELYACGGGDLVMYRADQPDQAPEPIKISLEGQQWQVCAVSSSPRGLLCGSYAGAVAALAPRAPHAVEAAAFVFDKIVHMMEWHPQQTSSSSEESPYKNLIAVSSMDKENMVVILEYGTKEDGTKQLTTWKKLAGHKTPVLQVYWSPHNDEQLLSTSNDATVRVWDVAQGVCLSIFAGHSSTSLGASWLSASRGVLSGGGDACLRLWDPQLHKAELYEDSTEIDPEIQAKKQGKKAAKKEKKSLTEPITTATVINDQSAIKMPKRFLLPLMYKQINDPRKVQVPRRMFELCLQKTENANMDKGDGDNKNVPEETRNTSTIVKDGGDANTEIDDKRNTNAVVDKDAVDEKGGCENSTDNVEIDLDCLKIFGTTKEVNEFLDLEMERHLESYQFEPWIMLSIFRGHIDTMIQFASEHDMLCPFLLSIAPCVSLKYWKDATQLYLAQIDRLVAKGREAKLYENRQYGGSIYRKAAILLSMHDVKGAVAVLAEGKLFKEAYVLCRLRYMDSIADEILKKWAHDLSYSGQMYIAAVCHIALNNLSEAAEVLSRINDQASLGLAAEIAKFAGRNSFADHVEKKALIKSQEITTHNTKEMLKQLPSKMELLMKETDKDKNGDTLKSEKSDSVTETKE